MVHGDLKGVWLSISVATLPPNPTFIKANILINQNGRACLADFGFLAVVSDPTNPTASSTYTIGGTIRWMSPELLLVLNHSGLKNGRPTKKSDCYALGMVIYEVLSGQAPFSHFNNYMVMWKVMGGERPERPEGAEGAWFTDDLWRMLNECWATEQESRPSVATVLECLELVSRDPEPRSLQTDGNYSNFTTDYSRRSNPRCFAALLRRILC